MRFSWSCLAEPLQLAPIQLKYTSPRLATETRPIHNSKASGEAGADIDQSPDVNESVVNINKAAEVVDEADVKADNAVVKEGEAVEGANEAFLNIDDAAKHVDEAVSNANDRRDIAVAADEGQ
jgi:hypothetical protein